MIVTVYSIKMIFKSIKHYIRTVSIAISIDAPIPIITTKDIGGIVSHFLYRHNIFFSLSLTIKSTIASIASSEEQVTHTSFASFS